MNSLSNAYEAAVKLDPASIETSIHGIEKEIYAVEPFLDERYVKKLRKESVVSGLSVMPSFNLELDSIPPLTMTLTRGSKRFARFSASYSTARYLGQSSIRNFDAQKRHQEPDHHRMGRPRPWRS
jgi:hypothetical protein